MLSLVYYLLPFLRFLFSHENLNTPLLAPFLNKSSPPFHTFSTKTSPTEQCTFRTTNREKPVIDNLTREVAIASAATQRVNNSISMPDMNLSESEKAFLLGAAAASSTFLYRHPELSTDVLRCFKVATLSHSETLASTATMVSHACLQSVSVGPILEELFLYNVIAVKKVCPIFSLFFIIIIQMSFLFSFT